MYGSPKYSGKHAQDPAPFLSRQIAFAPQGEGLHGSLGDSIVVRAEIKKFCLKACTRIKEEVIKQRVCDKKMSEHKVVQ